MSEVGLTHPNQVVGQDRAVRLLGGYLDHPEARPRGYVFAGPHGVGATSLARMFAQALMCPSGKWQCPGCPACTVLLDARPDFVEVQARGLTVERARALAAPRAPEVCKVRVVLIEDAELIPPDAWEALVAPLRREDSLPVFLFTTTEPKRIEHAVNHLAWLVLDRVAAADLLGLLLAAADRRVLPYTLDGLRRVAELAEGSPRQALRLLDQAALTGPVTPEVCAATLVEDLSQAAVDIFERLLEASQGTEQQSVAPLRAAFALAELAAERRGTAAVLRALFCCYSDAMFWGGELARVVPDYKRMQSTFLRWMAVPGLPIDALAMVLMELSEHFANRLPLLSDPVKIQAAGLRPKPARLAAARLKPDHPDGILTIQEMKKMAGVQ